MAPGKRGEFNLHLFATTRDRIVKNGLKETPKTREAKAAVVAAALKLTERRDVVNLEEWIATASPAEIKRLTNKVGKIDPRKGISPRKAEILFLDILAITHQEKATFRGLVTKGFTNQEKQNLLHWARTEFAQKPFVEALEGLGLVKDQGVRDVLRRRIAKHPNVKNVINNIFFNAFFMTLFPMSFHGIPLPYAAPKLTLLKQNTLSPALRAKITRKGIDEAFGDLHARYGKQVRFQTAWNYARHIATGALMAYAITQIYPGFMTSLLPPNYIDPEKDSAFDMGMKVIDHYTRLSALIRWEGIRDSVVGMIWPRNPEIAPAPGPAPAPIVQPDALPPGETAQAATDDSLNADTSDPSEASGDYAPPTFDPAPDMPPDVPVSDLPAVPPSMSASASSAAMEPQSDVTEF